VDDWLLPPASTINEWLTKLPPPLAKAWGEAAGCVKDASQFIKTVEAHEPPLPPGLDPELVGAEVACLRKTVGEVRTALAEIRPRLDAIGPPVRFAGELYPGAATAAVELAARVVEAAWRAADPIGREKGTPFDPTAVAEDFAIFRRRFLHLSPRFQLEEVWGAVREQLRRAAAMWETPEGRHEGEAPQAQATASDPPRYCDTVLTFPFAKVSVTRKKLDGLQLRARMLLEYMRDRERAPLARVCPEVWEEEEENVKSNAISVAIHKANTFLGQLGAAGVLAKIRGESVIEWQ
jgi:hypothetical protein